MCFKFIKYSRAKIAKTDIECWKVINKNKTNALSHLSHIPQIKYKKGEICEKQTLQKEGYTFYVINKGYHSYKTKADAAGAVWCGLSVLKNRYCYKEFIIPAGTRYYENKEEYVSETIMML